MLMVPMAILAIIRVMLKIYRVAKTFLRLVAIQLRILRWPISVEVVQNVDLRDLKMLAPPIATVPEKFPLLPRGLAM